MPGDRLLAAGLLVLSLFPAAAGAEREPTAAELTNFALSPELAQWLVGPISKIASPDEISRYLALEDDEAALAFVDSFWDRRRSASNPWPEQQPRAIFEQRAEEADRLFTEGTNLGRRTHRGEVHVLYGPPEEKRFESDPDRRRDPIEVWEYEKQAPKGLDGRRPKRFYRFVERSGVTVFLASAETRP